MTSKCSLDKFNQDYVPKSNNTLHVPVDPNKSFNPNLESPTDLDDICTSISQVPINPLYFDNPSAISKIALPEAKLLEDDRFWGGQVEKKTEMISKTVDMLDNQQIIEFTSESVDSFTPNKKKEKLPGSITRWSVALISKNLVIVGNDTNGRRQITSCCRRISSNIFHDNNGVVCSLLGPSEPASDLPKYISDKFKNGIPEDWQSVVITWGHYQSLGCPTSYKWPTMSQSYSHVNNYETDTEIGQNRTTLTVQQLRKKITKMQTRYRTMLFRESLLGSCTNSIHDSSLALSSNIDIPRTNLTNKIDNLFINRTVKENHKVLNNSLFSRDKKIEIVSFHKNTTPVLEDISTEKSSESLHLELVSSGHSGLNKDNLKTNHEGNLKTNEGNPKTSEGNPKTSEGNPKTNEVNPKTKENQTKDTPKAVDSKTVKRNILSESEMIFSASETKKPTEKSANLIKSGSSSFVSVNFSSLSKVSSIKDAQNTKISKNVYKSKQTATTVDPNSSDSDPRKSKYVSRIEPDSSDVNLCFKHPETIKSRGKNRKTVTSNTENNESPKNPKNSQVSVTTPDTKPDTKLIQSPKIVKKRGRPPKNKSAAQKSKLVSSQDGLVDSEESTASATPRKSGRLSKNKSTAEKSQTNTSQKEVAVFEASLKRTNIENINTRRHKSKDIISTAVESTEEIFKPTDKLKRSETLVEVEENVSEKSDRFLKPPDIETIKRRGRKPKDYVSTAEESTEKIFKPANKLKRSETSVEVEQNVSEKPDRFLKSPHIETIKRRVRKPKDYISTAEESTEETFEPTDKRNLSETSVEVEPNVSNKPDGFLKPPDIQTIKKRGRQQRKPKDNTPTVQEATEKVLKLADKDSVKKRGRKPALNITKDDNSQCSDSSSFSELSNSVSSVSSRGRVRVPTLPYWQGHRIATYKDEVLIEKSRTEKCDISSYVNNTISTIDDVSIRSKSPRKSQKPAEPDNSLIYDEVFNKDLFKNAKKPVAMQLTSTLRDSLINDLDNRQDSPFKQTNNKRPKSPDKNVKSPVKQNNLSSPPKQLNAKNATRTNVKHSNLTVVDPSTSSIVVNQQKTRNRIKSDFTEDKSNHDLCFKHPDTIKNIYKTRKESPVKQQTINNITKSPAGKTKNTNQKSPQKQLNDRKELNEKKQLSYPETESVEINGSEQKQSPIKKRTRSASKSQNNLTHEIRDIKIVLENVQSPIKKRTKSSSKKLDFDESPPRQTSKSSTIQNTPKTLKAEAKSSKSSTKKSKNLRKSPEEQLNDTARRSSGRKRSKINYKEELMFVINPESLSTRSSGRKRPHVNYKENLMLKIYPKSGSQLTLSTQSTQSTLNTQQSTLNTSSSKQQQKVEMLRKSARKSKSKSAKYTADNNFNFDVQDITSIEENIPKRQVKDNKMGPKITMQFKPRKPRKIKEFVIPTDPGELHLLANKSRKALRKEAPVIQRSSPRKSEPKKRKLFTSNSWLQSDECLEYLSKNNPENQVTGPRFVLKFEPNYTRPETDDEKFSEVSAFV